MMDERTGDLGEDVLRVDEGTCNQGNMAISGRNDEGEEQRTEEDVFRVDLFALQVASSMIFGNPTFSIYVPFHSGGVPDTTHITDHESERVANDPR